MRKYHDPLHEIPTRRRRSRAPAAVALGLALLFAPLLYEGGQVLVGRWVSMTGTHREARTPILDAIAERSRTARVDFQRYTYHIYHGGPWNASTAVPLAIIWAALMAVVFLRRVR